MKFTPAELSIGIEGLCEAAGLDISAYSDELMRVMLEYGAPPNIRNSFEAVLEDPAAQMHPPSNVHSILNAFMNRFMADYNLKVMDKKMLVREKRRHMLLSTLLGEADVRLVERTSGESIMGKPGSAANERFAVKFYGLRRRLFIHEDFMLPTIGETRAKRELSRKYIANFDYCSLHRPAQASAFYDSPEAAVTLAGMYFNIVDTHLEEGRDCLRPEFLDEFVDALEDAVIKAAAKPARSSRGATNRLHGLLTKSASRLAEEMGLKAGKWYEKIQGLQNELRASSQKGAGIPGELARGSRLGRYR